MLRNHGICVMVLVIAACGSFRTDCQRANVLASETTQPNVVYVFSDQHRWQSMSFTEMPELHTPNMDRLAEQGLSFNHCISNYPLCAPHRAMLLTSRWPSQQGVVENDRTLSADEMTIGKAFKAAGYATAYIGKWHLGGTRAEPFGFDHSLIWTNTNDHWRSVYFPAGADPVLVEGQYNATVMTDQALEFIEQPGDEPFFLILSLNPPHNDFADAPPEQLALYPDWSSLPLRPNVRPPILPKLSTAGGFLEALSGVPDKVSEISDTVLTMVQAAVEFPGRLLALATQPAKLPRPWTWYQGYHAHISAIDQEIGRVMDKLDELGLTENTILIYTSDHGEMMGSRGMIKKRLPFDESIRVPFIIRWPGEVPAGGKTDVLFGSIDIMPSVCGLAGVPCPDTVQGLDFSPTMRGQQGPDPESLLIMCISTRLVPLIQQPYVRRFRGLRTKQYTYVVTRYRSRHLFDNLQDPYQLHNLIDQPEYAELRSQLSQALADWLEQAGDPFQVPDESGRILPGDSLRRGAADR